MPSPAAHPSALPRMAWRLCSAFAIVAVLAFFRCQRPEHGEALVPPPKPAAPPDLEKLRPSFEAGIEALQRGEGAVAVQNFRTITFGSRAVEEYRLYFLAQGHQLQRDRNAARLTLADLWSRHPRMAYSDDVGLNLGSLYGSEEDWHHAAETLSALGQSSTAPAIAGNANWQAVETSFYDGTLSAVADAAKAIVVHEPRSTQAASAVAVLRSLGNAGADAPLPLTVAERLDRAMSLLRDGDPVNALEELDSLDDDASSPAGELKSSLQLQRGLALAQVRRFDDSNRQLETLTSGPYRYAIPALRQSARNYRVLSNSINPIVNKVIVERKQVGTVKVKQKGKKPLLKPKFANVRRTVELIDLAAKARKESYDHLFVERLKDLLALPCDDDTSIETLNGLIGIAEAKHQEEYEQQLVTRMAAVDPATEAGLQHFWDEAWAAYLRGDMATTRPLLAFISKTYRSPNIKRQADYWAARSSERVGDKGGATAIYQKLLSASYDDLYALEAQARGAKRVTQSRPPGGAKEDWQQIAEREMPRELRLAYELNALSDPRDARVEIQRNASRTNQHYANALLGELYNSSGLYELAYRYLKLAFPKLATAEQDEVPPYFLKMYYPAKYVDAIRKQATKNGIDPYLVMALIHQESAFNPKAHSSVGAMGLMQLMPATARELGSRLRGSFSTSRLENADFNIELGTYHLKHMIDLFGGNVQLAVASYNAGQGNVMKWKRANRRPMDELLESIPFPETRNYVKRVTILSSGYRRLNEE
jgi:soluble lytic murein transglycosylase-like protein